MRRAKPELPSFPPAVIEALDQAWTRYQAARRTVYVGAPHAMRRFFRTQNQQALTVDLTRYVSTASSGTRGWHAACRRVLGRHVLVEPMGTTVLGMPTGFLVRVPRKGTYAGRDVGMDERLWGRAVGDPEALERLAAVRAARRRDSEDEQRAERVQRLYGRMVAALAEARSRLALKGRALDHAQAIIDRGITSSTVRDEVQALRRASYGHHARYVRCLGRANRYKRLLAAQGFMYDLNSIDTPVEISVGEGARA